MQSTLTSRETDPHDIFLIEPDVTPAARADQAPSRLVQEILSHPSAPPAHMAFAGASPSVDTTFRATDVNHVPDNIHLLDDRSSSGGWARRALIGFLFAVCSAVAAAAWQHYGHTAKAMIAAWTPPFALTSSPPAEQPALAEQPSSVAQAPATDQTAAATDQAAAAAQPAAPAQPTAPAQPAPAVAPDVAAVPPDSAQSVEKMARDVASMGQQIEQLRASIEQLKAGQEQMSRDMAKNAEARNAEARNAAAKTFASRTSEPNLRPRISAPPPRSAAAPARQPRPAYYPPPAAAAPPLPQTAPLLPEPPPQATAEDGAPLVRPPMPLR
jgi:hypothetical protein